MGTRNIALLVGLMVLGGCASAPPPVVPDAEGKEFVSAIGMGCSSPWELARHCNAWSGPDLDIALNGVEMAIGATSDGRTVVFFGDSSGDETANTNTAYDVVKRELSTRDITITDVTPVASGGVLFGYAISADEDIYAVLSQYATE